MGGYDRDQGYDEDDDDDEDWWSYLWFDAYEYTNRLIRIGWTYHPSWNKGRWDNGRLAATLFRVRPQTNSVIKLPAKSLKRLCIFGTIALLPILACKKEIKLSVLHSLTLTKPKLKFRGAIKSSPPPLPPKQKLFRIPLGIKLQQGRHTFYMRVQFVKKRPW